MIPIDEQENIPPIDELICYQKRLLENYQVNPVVTLIAKNILASLERLKAIDAVQVPEEPTMLSAMRMVGNAPEVIKHVDTLRDLLKREIARAHKWEAEADKQFQYAGRVLEQANAAESKLAAMLKLGAEPSKEMSQAGYMVDSTVEGTGYEDIFKAMFAKLIDQAGVKK